MRTLQNERNNMDNKFILNPRYDVLNMQYLLDKTNYRKYSINTIQYHVMKYFQYEPQLPNLEQIEGDYEKVDKYLVLIELLKKNIILSVCSDIQFQIVF